MLNEQGYIAECTADNVFIIKGGTLFTPPVSAGSLRGITRGTVLDLAAELGVPVVETELTRYDVFVADECFLTGTAAELVAVVKVRLARHRRRQARASDAAPAGTLPPFDSEHRNADIRRKRPRARGLPAPERCMEEGTSAVALVETAFALLTPVFHPVGNQHAM